MRACLEPRSVVRAVQRLDSNWHPLSMTIVEGVPNQETHPRIKALVTSSAVCERNSFWPPSKMVNTG